MSPPPWPQRRLAETLGAYAPNQFLITLGPDYQLVDEKGAPVSNPSRETVGVFGHEYMHYVDNISTLAGASSFVLSQQLAATLSATMNADGTSRGSGGLPQAEQDALRQRLGLFDFLEGAADPSPMPHGVEDVLDFDVTHVTADPISIDLPAGTCRRTRVVLTCEVEAPSGKYSAKFELGLLAIEEGIAYEIDRMIAGAGGDADDDAPPFPYLVLRRLAQVHGPDGLSRVVLVACAILALQTTDPPATLLLVLEFLKGPGSVAMTSVTERIAYLLGEAAASTQDHRQGGTKVVLEDLQSVVEQHRGRGVGETAARHLVDLYTRNLQHRLREPFWELDPFRNNVADPKALSELLARQLPCDFVQERDDDEQKPERDFLGRFGGLAEAEAAKTDPAIDAVRTLQCQLHMFDAHRSRDVLAPSAGRAAQCPFYTSCDHELRTKHSDVCRREPWRSRAMTGNPTCFYGGAVGGLLGLEVTKAEEAP